MTNKYIYRLIPRFSDTDAYGVMHHSSYFKWFEEARISFASNILGISMEEFNEKKIKLPVIESYCKYIYAIKYGDIIDIEVKIKFHKAPKWTIYYKIYNKNDTKIYAEGYTVHIYLNEKNQILLNHPEWIMKKIQMLLKNDKSLVYIIFE